MTPSGIKISVLDPGEIPRFAAFTYPVFREMVTTPPDREMLYIGAVGTDGEPVGLAYGMGGPNGEYEMISVYVGALFRNTGIGKPDKRFA